MRQKELIKELILGPEGFEVAIFGLFLYKDGERFVVENDNPEFIKSFDNVDEAIDSFLKFTKDCQLGVSLGA